MAEQERTRERVREPLTDNPYERVMAARKEREDRQFTGKVVIKPADRQIFQSRQGQLMFYLEPDWYPETPLHNFRVFTHTLKTKSGKHRHQGGLVIYVLDGHGYSIVDGERWDWKKGDLVLLPVRPGGVEHQHFNGDPDHPSRWVAFIPLPVNEYVASELVQLEASPDFKEQ